ncbi:hypothetical protein MHIB_03170 [Mycolicibacter hiberniae]|uniref:Uncharacterized protein n=1 Tax=Mycolicibacter hiberniae TaxID=29314 RepID=A0A7I7WW95_9MYCO|nr:hypothetical protein MHIB_03170 [Mycolicibacter hiberniae]
MPLGVLRGVWFASGCGPAWVTVRAQPDRASAVAAIPNAQSHRLDMQRNLPVGPGRRRHGIADLTREMRVAAIATPEDRTYRPK